MGMKRWLIQINIFQRDLDINCIQVNESKLTRTKTS